MSEAIYWNESYCKEFESAVESVKDDKYVVLDKTAFYPVGGGQPHDTGSLVRESDGQQFPIVFVRKVEGKIRHEIGMPGLKDGDKVKGIIDWERRYKLMRMHTAAHVLSAVINRLTGSLVTGKQLDIDKSRIDFNLEKFDKCVAEQFIEEANKTIEQGSEVKTYSMPREEALKIPGMIKLAEKMPPAVSVLRIVEINSVDIQACGGTHVKEIKEIGPLKLVKTENKGRKNRRIYFTL